MYLFVCLYIQTFILQPPQPPKRWEGIRDATRERNGCISRHSLFRKVEGSEDCLLLNVYSPMVRLKLVLNC